MTAGEEAGTYQRVERRIRDDLHLEDADVNGIMVILREEIDPLDYTLKQWACDRCGIYPSTATKRGEALCNNCIFGVTRS